MKIKFLINNFKIFGIFKTIKNSFYNNKIRIFNTNNSLNIESEDIKNLDLKINGINNKIIIKNNVKLKNLNIQLSGNNNILQIERNSFIQNSTITVEGNNNITNFGYENSIYGIRVWQFENDGIISIGNSCLLSYNIEIRNTDSHPIYELKTGKRINQSKDVVIKDKVWIGQGAKILKGVTIESGNVIGLNSIITKNILNKNSIVVGNNKIVRKDIIWKKDFIKN
ncbi:hypothetical protein C4N20_02580 [Fusobacterium ulcerans]|uniref:Acetyltransferase SACOL2570 n=1 Tax=Fusobacterium ulcerans TaxID=861 RepID=A0AAX2JDY7_9FUSO|nr:hypothetical protein [Fusobacterium ulcerans]AVQ27020.1 hypothetical protein C4N20_02580 [Fusobacterium ulcerans]EFS24853.2 hypothetical protein FUAG_00368 [Fusobacterium ulcerans ATCC 49185]SQJ09825.1 Putative acetyltransferase SACOL2570 [Fusobacterium ulcerans]